MALAAVFLLGILNFVLHRGALARGARMLPGLSRRARLGLGGMSLLVEFVLLAVSLAMVARGQGGWLWGYLLYSAGNGIAAWLLLRRER